MTVHETDNGMKPDFTPGSIGCHEALHMASFLCAAVDEQLCEHEAVKLNPEWVALADRARDALMDLYQAIGAEHL
jgi:hypothetical protein